MMESFHRVVPDVLMERLQLARWRMARSSPKWLRETIDDVLEQWNDSDRVFGPVSPASLASPCVRNLKAEPPKKGAQPLSDEHWCAILENDEYA